MVFLLQSKTRWQMKERNDENIEIISTELDISPMVARLIVNRGIRTIDEARLFLNKNDARFHDPFLLDTMDVVIERIEKAIEKNEKILVFGDYDADGVSSTTVMVKALEKKGAMVDFYIPNRFTEGYGPNEDAFKWAHSNGYSIIITVDTGISASHEAKVAKQLGIDLIITDHHELPPELPLAFAIIHPRKPGSRYPFGKLAGVGVALKIAHALLGDVPKELLQLAAIGTIADLVPLRDENRLIASLGIQALQHTNNFGLRALLKMCGCEDKEITEETIGFMIGPRINAVGRLGSADPAVELLMTDSLEDAEIIANEIDSINRERQQIVTQITEEAMKEVEENFYPDQNNVLVIAKEGWNPGVIGIVASRLVEKYYRPTIILNIDSDKGEAKGSARSIDGFDLFKNLSNCRDLLLHFGGHTMAAGMTLKLENISKLRERLNQIAGDILTEDDFVPLTHVDIQCSLDEISTATIEEISLLAPFGVGNPKPIVCLEDLSLQQIRKMGSQMDHLKMIFEKDGHILDAVGFGYGYLMNEISPLSKINVIGELSINEWNGFRKPQFILKDAAVKEWQLFDLRGKKDVKKQLQLLELDRLSIIAFREQTIERLNLVEWKDKIHVIRDEASIEETMIENKSIVILDLPDETITIKKLMKAVNPERIYAIFDHVDNHFFSTLPTREHFKWYYSFLLKYQPFDVEKYANVLSRKKGWSKETIHFMTEVFFDLEFAKIDNGVISLVENPTKKDFTASKTYSRKQELLQLENDLIYSSYQALKDWFDEAIGTSRKIEEEVLNEL